MPKGLPVCKAYATQTGMSRSIHFNVRLFEGESQRYEQAARRAGKSASEWARDVLNAAAGTCPTCGTHRDPNPGKSEG